MEAKAVEFGTQLRGGWPVCARHALQAQHFLSRSRPERCGRCMRPLAGPVQQRLALALAAGEFARLAVFLDLPNVAADRLPTLDLTAVFVRHAPAHVVAGVPLEPAARVVAVN